VIKKTADIGAGFDVSLKRARADTFLKTPIGIADLRPAIEYRRVAVQGLTILACP
jgi:hypothetical protein